MLTESCLSTNFWGEAVLHACYFAYTTPARPDDRMTPFGMLFRQIPSKNRLRVFGRYTNFLLRSKRDQGSLPGDHAQVSCWGLEISFIIYGILPVTFWLERSIWYLMKMSSQHSRPFEEESLTLMHWVRLNLKTMQAVLPSMSM